MNLHHNFLFGSELTSSDSIKVAVSHGHRDCYPDLMHYLRPQVNDKAFKHDLMRVCVLYGLRRTGKTTMMFQAIAEKEESEPGSCAYCSFEQGAIIEDVFDDLEELRKNGTKYVFLDEVTSVDGLTEQAGYFANHFAAWGMRVVLTGTNSFALSMSEDETLYDRTVDIRTSVVTFAEWSRLIGGNIDDYMRYGGLLAPGDRSMLSDSNFSDWKKASRYYNTAVVQNVIQSLERAEELGTRRTLGELRDYDLLLPAVLKALQDNSHTATPRTLMKPFTAKDMGSAGQQARERGAKSAPIMDRRSEYRKKVDDIVKTVFFQGMGARDTDVKISEFERRAVLDALVDVGALSLFSKAELNPDGDVKFGERYAIAQPGMRYAFSTEIQEALKAAVGYVKLAEQDEDDPVAEAFVLIDSEVRGRLMEDIVLADTIADIGKFSLGRPSNVISISGSYYREDGELNQRTNFEFDMAVLDTERGGVKLYEIKHQLSQDENQTRHLIDETALGMVESKFGKIIERAVIYRGEPAHDPFGNGVNYLNVEEFLKESHEDSVLERGYLPILGGPKLIPFRGATDKETGKDGTDIRPCALLPEGYRWVKSRAETEGLVSPSNEILVVFNNRLGAFDFGEGFQTYKGDPSPKAARMLVEQHVADELGIGVHIDLSDDEVRRLAGEDGQGPRRHSEDDPTGQS